MNCAAVVLTAFCLIATWVAIKTRDVLGWLGVIGYGVAASLCWLWVWLA